MILTKPIVFFDLETTGLNISRDRIVELSYIVVKPDGSEQSNTIRINPEMHIPDNVVAVHHITDDDVRDCPTFREVAPALVEIFTDCYIAGYNSDHFDLPLLAEEFLRAGVEIDLKANRTIDVQTIFFKKEPRNLKAAYRFYCNRELDNAHSANADTMATYEIFKAQLERYQDLPDDMERLSNFTTQKRFADFAGFFVYNANGQVVFDFGKHKGKTLEEVFTADPGYCSWFMNGDFPQYSKYVIKKLRDEFQHQKKLDALMERWNNK